MISDTEKYKIPSRGEYDFKKVAQDDPRVWAAFGRGETIGIFQLEKQLGQDWSRRLKPENIEQLAALTALLRPACLECLDGDVEILRRQYYDKKGNLRYQYEKIKDLYQDFQKWQKNPYKGDKLLKITSLDEETKELFYNNIVAVYKSGIKDVYRVNLKLRFYNEKYSRRKFYNIQATNNHRFLTLEGWKRLEDIKIGEYIAVNNKNFGNIKRKDKIKPEPFKVWRERCLYNFKYECVFCDWNLGSLDVNHIESRKFGDNSAENLCFMCPNHHRLYTEGKISKEETLKNRELKRLPNTKDIRWVMYKGKEYIGQKETYDIEVVGPNHNYIAGNFVVHNSKMADDYCDRKNGIKSVEYFHPELKDIFAPTYGCNIYQEQSIAIGQKIAGMSEEEADTYIRKGIGKKLAEVIAECKKRFLEGCKKVGKVNEEEAKEIFSWLEKAQRYQFNKSHSVSYAKTAYQTMYAKVHFPTEFYCSWLSFADWKPDPKEEIFLLVNDAKRRNVQVLPPNIAQKNMFFKILKDREILFGLSSIKGVGQKAVESLSGLKLDNFNEFLMSGRKIKRNICEALIKSGACDTYGKTRNSMLKDLWCLMGRSDKKEDDGIEEIKEVKKLTDKEYNHVLNKLKTNSLKDSLVSLLNSKDSVAKRKPVIEAKIKWLDAQPSDTNKQKAIWEKLYLGLNLSCSAADDIEKDLKCDTCRSTYLLKPKESFKIIVVVDDIIFKKTGPKSKNPGKEYAYLVVSDNTGAINNLVVWPELWEENKNYILPNTVVKISGRKDSWGGKEQLSARTIEII